MNKTRRTKQQEAALSKLPAIRPYQPPRVIRRAGSEVAATLPSVAAGKQHQPGRMQ